jgi:hypothetical protein
VPSTTRWSAEIDGKTFSGMIEIDGSFWAISLKTQSATGSSVFYILMENELHLVVMTPDLRAAFRSGCTN